ncbi:MAG: hypothetical protein LBV45_03020 [Xanthomonadaceae bacterium]|jgi:hypothetical protein|nr:hypothetical protein [Xanthomonadaceae bacterium]
MISIRFFIVVLLTVMVLPAWAQQKTASSSKRLYCWEEPNGRRTCSDTLPPEAMGHAREEISAKSGLHLSSVERTLTPEEQALKAFEDTQRKMEETAAAARHRTDQIMLLTYQNEDDLRRVFNDSIVMADNNIKTATYNRNRLRENLLTPLRAAARAELEGRPVPDKVNTDIRQQRAELLAQLQLLKKFERQRVDLDIEIQTTLQRYRELRDRS